MNATEPRARLRLALMIEPHWRRPSQNLSYDAFVRNTSSSPNGATPTKAQSGGRNPHRLESTVGPTDRRVAPGTASDAQRSLAQRGAADVQQVITPQVRVVLDHCIPSRHRPMIDPVRHVVIVGQPLVARHAEPEVVQQSVGESVDPPVDGQVLPRTPRLFHGRLADVDRLLDDVQFAQATGVPFPRRSG